MMVPDAPYHLVADTVSAPPGDYVRNPLAMRIGFWATVLIFALGLIYGAGLGGANDLHAPGGVERRCRLCRRLPAAPGDVGNGSPDMCVPGIAVACGLVCRLARIRPTG